MADFCCIDDRDRMPETEQILIEWPDDLEKPRFAVVKDFDPYPHWTKTCRFLENNNFQYDFLDILSSDWINQAKSYDVITGIVSNEHYHLLELRRKYYILENYLGKKCYPSLKHLQLYEDKTLEAFIAQTNGIPFAPTHYFTKEEEALNAIRELQYPQVSKIDPGSGSMGIELITNLKKARKVVNQSFSPRGRTTQSLYFRQKNYVYFQDFIPNDGFDIRVIVIDEYIFGFYRKVLKGDFRASGMNLVEKRDLPESAIRIARDLYKKIGSPLLAVDMVHGLDGQYYIIEFSPLCQLRDPERLHVNGVPGAYVFSDDKCHFIPGKFWLCELALRQFLVNEYIKSNLNVK